MIWKWKEGSLLKPGLNIACPNPQSHITLILKVPYWLTKREKYDDFELSNLYFPHQIRYMFVYFRVRNMKGFSKGVSRFLFDITFHKKPFGRIIRRERKKCLI